MWLLNESYISRRRMENLVLGTGSIAPNPVEALRELRNVGTLPTRRNSNKPSRGKLEAPDNLLTYVA